MYACVCQRATDGAGWWARTHAHMHARMHYKFQKVQYAAADGHEHAVLQKCCVNVVRVGVVRLLMRG